MKIIPLLFLIVLFAANTVFSVKHFAQKLCITGEDCDWDQCCISAQTRIPGFKGICSPPTQRGEFCNPDPNDITKEGRYTDACPCDSGLSCQIRQESEGGNVRDIYVCQP